MMKKFLTIFFSGVLFSSGLFISGMTDPSKVIGFLDITGAWDPSLVFVMMGAIIPTFFVYRTVFSKGKSWFSDFIDLPSKKDIDRPLVLGAILFGIGWGLSGICPGPAMANIIAGKTEFLIFGFCMMVGMFVGGRVQK